MARKFQVEIAAMAHTQSLSLLPRNGHSVPFVELRQSLPSKVAAISPFTEQLMRFILNFRMADGSEIDIEMALREALANAVIHGNGDDSRKSVYVTCRCYMDGEVSITVRDEGKGFDSSAVLDPTVLENLLFTHGRGIYLMKTLMDEVSFERRRGCHNAKEIQRKFGRTEETVMTRTLSTFVLAILRAGALGCVVLLFSDLGLAQKVVTAKAAIPFTFWAGGHEVQAREY